MAAKAAGRPPPDSVDAQRVAAETREAGLVEQLLQAERGKQAQGQLEAARALFQEACAARQRAEQQAGAVEAEALQVGAFYRRELLARAAEVAAAREEAAAAAQRAEEERATGAAREAAAAAAAHGARGVQEAQIAALQAQLAGLQQFAAERESLQQQLARAGEEREAAAAAAEERIRALQRRVYELGGGGGSGSEGERGGGSDDGASSEGGDEGGEQDRAAALSGDLRRLLAHNRRMAEQMRLYGQESEGLQREMAGLEEERAALLRDATLRRELEQQYATQGTLQRRELRAAHTKIGSLERGLARLAADVEREKAELGEGLRAQLAEAVTEANSMRRLLRLRTRELRQVRRAAQEVLLQRSEVESFLVGAIRQVRGELEGERTAQQAQHAQRGSAGTRPPSGQQEQQAAAAAHEAQGSGGDGAEPTAGAAGAAAAAHGGGGGMTPGGAAAVDIRDLSWEERERVLRALFARIHNQQAARTPLPHHAEPAPPAPLRGAFTEAGPAALA